MKKPQDIESLFKDAFKDFEADPGANAWKNIQSQVSPAGQLSSAGTSSAATTTGSSWIITAVVSVTLAGIAVGGFYFFDNAGEKKKAKAVKEQAQKEEVVQTTPNTQDLKEEQEVANQAEEAIDKIKSTDQNTVNNKQTVVQKSTPKIQVKQEVEEAEAEKAETNLIDKDSELTNQTEESITTESSDEQRIEEESLEKKSTDKSEIASKTQSVEPVTDTKVESSTEVTSDVEQNTEEGQSTTQNNAIEDQTTDETPEVVVPNIITPNQDGINDAFNITSTEAEDIEVNIYSRTNKLLHQWNGKYGFWEGNMPDGTPAPEGTYFYIIIVKEGGKALKPIKGTFLLNR